VALGMSIGTSYAAYFEFSVTPFERARPACTIDSSTILETHSCILSLSA
jgi:hypothetical protein